MVLSHAAVPDLCAGTAINAAISISLLKSFGAFMFEGRVNRMCHSFDRLGTTKIEFPRRASNQV